MRTEGGRKASRRATPSLRTGPELCPTFPICAFRPNPYTSRVLSPACQRPAGAAVDLHGVEDLYVIAIRANRDGRRLQADWFCTRCPGPAGGGLLPPHRAPLGPRGRAVQPDGRHDHRLPDRRHRFRPQPPGPVRQPDPDQEPVSIPVGPGVQRQPPLRRAEQRLHLQPERRRHLLDPKHPQHRVLAARSPPPPPATCATTSAITWNTRGRTSTPGSCTPSTRIPTWASPTATPCPLPPCWRR